VTEPAQAAQPGTEADERRVHLLEAAADQRERVLTSFTDQREAIMKAVADQRAAAVAPIDAVRARLGGTSLRRPPQPLSTKAPAAAEAGGVVAEIVTILKALIADEVRLQLRNLLQPDAPAEAAPAPGPPPLP
jgi:hypothetical protein